MDFRKLKRTSLFERKSLVEIQRLTTPPSPPAAFQDFFEALPDFLKVRDLKALVQHIVQAKQRRKPILLMMGAHPIKVGLNRWLIQALQREWVSALALNGACMIHDFELAAAGTTSEDVAESLIDGRFGMTKETAQTLNQWINQAAQEGGGMGQSIGRALESSPYPHKALSLFAGAYRCRVPVTVHVALGTDVIHHHPEADGAAIGRTAMHDFHNLCDIVSDLGDGGVVLNVGSNVLLPEVFLKALTLARNIQGPIHNFTTANFDMVQHYRPNTNVVQRPILGGGQGYSFTGHHEIMLPLLFQALFEHEGS